MKGKAKFKFNNGRYAMLCSRCSVMLKEGRHFTDDEWKASRGELKMAPQYCDECEEKRRKNE